MILERDTVPRISCIDPDITQPMDVTEILEEAIRQCDRASERAILVQERNRIRGARK